jgi:hypothetical protein
VGDDGHAIGGDVRGAVHGRASGQAVRDSAGAEVCVTVGRGSVASGRLGCTQRSKGAGEQGGRGAEAQGSRGAGDLASLPPCLSARRADAEVYRVESYAACQFIYGPESDRPGDGSHSWATGTAAWTLVVVWGWMPGARPELD